MIKIDLFNDIQDLTNKLDVSIKQLARYGKELAEAEREEWRDIKDYEGLYQISNYGNVMSLDYRGKGKKHLLKAGILPIGYPIVVLCKNKKQSTKYIHRLVAEAFIPNPYNKPEVNHIDGCKTNNNIKNLEWVTYSENQKHACKKGLANVEKAWKQSVEKSRIAVAKISENGEIIKEYPSLAAAQRENSIGHSTIAECARGERETAGGYKWKIIDKGTCGYGNI